MFIDAPPLNGRLRLASTSEAADPAPRRTLEGDDLTVASKIEFSDLRHVENGECASGIFNHVPLYLDH